MPLPGSDEPGSQHGRPDRSDRWEDGGRHGGAMGDGHDLGWIDVEPGAQALPRRLRHHHDAIGQVGGGDQHRALVQRRRHQDRVRHHDRRDPQAGEHLEYFVAILAAIEAVLVLHDGDVTTVEGFCRCGDRRHRTALQLCDHASRARRALVDHPHDPNVGAVCDQPASEGGTERGQATCRRRIGAEDAEGAGAIRRAFEG